jgi:putative component of toxin-antitoxin plasmid stabilization module
MQFADPSSDDSRLPGLDQYTCERGGELIVLRAGGDKSTQPHDIKLAFALAANLED